MEQPDGKTYHLHISKRQNYSRLSRPATAIAYFLEETSLRSLVTIFSHVWQSFLEEIRIFSWSALILWWKVAKTKTMTLVRCCFSYVISCCDNSQLISAPNTNNRPKRRKNWECKAALCSVGGRGMTNQLYIQFYLLVSLNRCSTVIFWSTRSNMYFM